MTHFFGLRVANCVMAALMTALGGGIFMTWSQPAFAGEGSYTLAALSSLILALLGLVAVACFWVALVGPARARMLQTMLALALILTFPVGTAYSLYALWVCWGGGGKRKQPNLRAQAGFGVPAGAW